MLLLLPPSEAKAPGGDGPSLAELGVTGPSDPLSAARGRVLAAVARMSRRDTAAVRRALRLPAGSAAADLADNVAVLTSPTRPALARFSGVLYAALDLSTMTVRERRRAVASAVVFSGAFGVLAADDPVPMHRVPAAATVSGVGGLATFWRAALAAPMARRLEAERLVVDLRSSDYAAMWRPDRDEARRVVTVRVLEDRGGVLRPVSWSAKHGKGRLARELLHSHTARHPVRSRADVAAAGARLGYRTVERDLSDGTAGLDLVVPSSGLD